MINIEIAEEIIHLQVNKQNPPKKRNLQLQKHLIQKVVLEVQTRMGQIQLFITIANLIYRQQEKKITLFEKLIEQMNNVDSDLQQKLSRINKQKEELVQRQTQLENDLNQVRLVAEKRRDKKAKYEHQYNKISSVPILSIQSKKKYVQARDKNYATEQEVSEKRQILDQCRNHIRVLSKMIMAQQTEQTQLNEKREHSMNIIRSIVEQSLYLKEGRIYWTDFDEHQQVVLTYALQLMNMVKQYPTNTFDINNEWMQTFKLACLEYGDTVECGDKRWDTAIMKIDFECEQCQIPQSAWPFLCNNQLCCELCYMTQPSETHIIHESKMKKLIGSIFHLNRIE